MLLRRITKHLKEQNWFAVVLDFLIVVGGVFIGMQVTNWNEVRAFQAKEQGYLEQLKAEVDINVLVVESQQQYMATIIDAGGRALSFLEAEEACRSNCAGLLVDFFHASQVWGFPMQDSTFQAMIRLGLPSNPETRSQIESFYATQLGFSFVYLTPPKYRETVRSYFSLDAVEAMWGRCHLIDPNRIEKASRDCVEDLDEGAAIKMLDDIRADQDIEAQLRFWIGQNILSLQESDDLLEKSKLAQAAINAELKL